MILCGMGSEVRSAGLPAGAAIEAMDSDAAPTQLQESPNCGPNLAVFRAFLARVPRDAYRGHGSPTSVPGWSKLQIGVVVKAVRVRVS
jgi:hypothetical protein